MATCLTSAIVSVRHISETGTWKKHLENLGNARTAAKNS